VSTVVGLIPARAGTREKNLWRLAGRPLIAWAIDSARESELVTRVVVSTDSEQVADLARAEGAEVVERPPDLAADDTPMLPAIRHALDAVGACDALVLLQPTSPLRRGEHVDAALRLLVETGADSVVSVVEVPHRYRPVSLMALDGDRLVPLVEDAPARRQDKPVVYARNGPAVLALRPDRLGDSLYAGDCRAYVMAERDSVDVDDPDDLRLAEHYLDERR
jgi:CMP-N,N'-diacetyllegionaminic acid synthase